MCPQTQMWFLGIALDFNRRCVFWGGTGLCCYVCIGKKQGEIDWLHH